MKIFLSGTSTPFKACREQLRSDLAALGHEVRVQEDFQTGTGSLLKRIQDYVAACDRVIVLVGDAHGAEAAGEGVPARTPPQSYTQWEYFFAAGERLEGRPAEPKPMQLYFASDRFTADHPADENAELQKRQQDFVTRVTKSNRHRKPFDSVDQVCRWVPRDLSQIDANMPRLVDDETFWALDDLEDDLRAGATPSNRALELVRNHTPRTVREHWLHRVASWSDPRFAVDSRFTRLTLMLDQGRDAEQQRWQAQSESFDDLGAVLAKVTELGQPPVLVLLGPPGSGKSTLLRRLEYDLAADAVRREDADERWTFFVPLSSHKAPAGHALPEPQRWLSERWKGDFPHLPAFDEVSGSGRLTLLLDALNELPHASREDYADRVDLWRTFVADLVRRAPSTRIVFTCRSLDYSELLSTPELTVPQVRIERLSDEQVQDFLSAYSPVHGDRLWRQLKGTAQLDLFRSPYYLRLLVDRAGSDGTIPEGRAALFTGFVRQALFREIQANHPLFRVGGGLLDARDRDRLAGHQWATAVDLPVRGPLIGALSALAFGLQQRREGGEEAQVRASLDECLRLLGTGRPEDVLSAGVALQVLDDDRRRDEVVFVHQLLQEYFAARKAAVPGAVDAVVGLARVPWREAELPKVVFKSDSEPLPPAPPTGWEETFILAAAMMPSADPFVSALMDVNLPLAGRCAAQPDVRVSGALRASLQQALVERSRDPEADLRSRIAAARAVGELGDPRFECGRGPCGDYLLPAFVEIPGGTYKIGSDDHDDNERPTHRVELRRFSIATFPVTNAEWRRFMDSGGYEDHRWWRSQSAEAWRRGENTNEGPKLRVRANRRRFQEDPARISHLQSTGQITSKEAEEWGAILWISDDEFEDVLDDWYPPGRKTQPEQWNDAALNHPAQPVVGICWYEARAYCHWVSAQASRPCRLPTEIEWEAAARGLFGESFPWCGAFESRCCNTFESHLRATTPVGVFPAGDSPSGVTDMIGNVWEWTSSADRVYPYNADDGREDSQLVDVSRVTRGGSWNNYQDYARASYRNRVHPGTRSMSLGFRVVSPSVVGDPRSAPRPTV